MDPNKQLNNLPNFGVPIMPIPTTAAQSLPLLPTTLLGTPTLGTLSGTSLYSSPALITLQDTVMLNHIVPNGIFGPASLTLGLSHPALASVGLPLLVPPLLAQPNHMFFGGVDSLLRAAESSGSVPEEDHSSNFASGGRQERVASLKTLPTETELIRRNNFRSMDDMDGDETSEEASDDGSVPSLPYAASAPNSSSENEIDLEDVPIATEMATRGYATRSRSKVLTGGRSSSLPGKYRAADSRPQSVSDFDIDAKSTPTPLDGDSKTVWDQLDIPLPSISAPRLFPAHSFDSRSMFMNSLAFVDNKAPIFEKLDSPSIWSTPATAAAPLHAEYLRSRLLPNHVPHPIFLSHSIAPVSEAGTSRSAKGTASVAASASTSTRGRKKRVRSESPFDECGVVDPSAKRLKSRDLRDNAMEAILEGGGGGGGDDDGIEDSSANKLAAAPSAKRRISKIDETVEIKRDESGSVIMPLVFGAIIVVSLGRVVPHGDKFHSRRYIFPLGYTSKRTYYSLKTPSSRCWYVQEVLSSTTEPKEPIFRLTCEDDPEYPIQSNTPSGVWSEVLERIKPQREAIVGRALHSTISGPEQFGFSHPIIHQLIEELPDALQCANYDPNLFFQPDPRGKRSKTKESAPE